MTESTAAPTLLVLAAGMGSRYGGLKQVDPMGPNGETLLDYSVRHAIAAGFVRVVFVIRKDIDSIFREKIGNRYAESIGVDYAYQELDCLPSGFKRPAERTKPWGTGHALLVARESLNSAFAVINADDYYGPTAYKVLAQHLGRTTLTSTESFMVAWELGRTLSPSGSVNRGICQLEDDNLTSVTEFTEIARKPDGSLTGLDPSATEKPLSMDTPVSMNFWGFTPALFADLEAAFTEFLEERITLPKAEFYLPAFMDSLLQAGKTTCRVLHSPDNWYGVTYPEDKAEIQRQLHSLHD
jgi:choline kinase